MPASVNIPGPAFVIPNPDPLTIPASVKVLAASDTVIIGVAVNVVAPAPKLKSTEPV